MTIATILPTARTVFLDANNNPVAGGSVYFYVPPNTTTLKMTWQDATGTIPNTNPVILDGNGSALIYGSGQYLQEVWDSVGNLVWTGLTQDVYGLIVNGDNTFTGNNTFTGTTTFTGGFILPDDYVTNDMLALMQPNTVKVNNTAALANPIDLPLALNKLFGRGASGNLGAINLGTALSMSGNTLNAIQGLTTVITRVFTTSGTYTPSTGMVVCLAEVLGAGGGGGGGVLGLSQYPSGGGGGGYGKSLLSASDIGVGQTVTIGAGGAGGSGLGANDGAVGGTTSLGAIITCTGGRGGIRPRATGGGVLLPSPGGLGGTSTGANIVNLNGSAGGFGTPLEMGGSTVGISGAGANSQYGAGGNSIATPTSGATSNGNPGLGYGSGGGGAGENGKTGGAGMNGLVIITEYCTQ